MAQGNPEVTGGAGVKQAGKGPCCLDDRKRPGKKNKLPARRTKLEKRAGGTKKRELRV